MSEPAARKNTYRCAWNHAFDVATAPSEGSRVVCPLCGSIKTRVSYEPLTPEPTTLAGESQASLTETVDATIAGQFAEAETGESVVAEMPRYEMLNELGRGACGVVYRVRDQKLGRDVALKQLLRFSPRSLQMFKQEFRSLADIAHPNIASLYDLYSDGDDWSFTMELLDAVEFNEYVWSGFDSRSEECHIPNARLAATGPRLSEDVMARLYDTLKQLAAGLSALHSAGVLHRDIKHSNVMVTTEHRVVLVDFGLAVEMSSTGSGMIQGTPAFMAPEQCTGSAASPATDWYGVGVMLYDILTGQLPYTGPLETILAEKQKSLPPEPRQIEPSIPEELNDLCMSLLQIDPANRPSAAEVLEKTGADPEVELLPVETAAMGRPDVELVGRDLQMKLLRDRFSRIADAHAARNPADSSDTQEAIEADSVFVHGRSGMGKSVLVERFLKEVQDESNALVLTGRCYEQEAVPFKALDSLMDSLATYLARLRERTVRKLIPEDSRPLARVFPVLGQLPGINDPERPSVENVEQQELRRRAMVALRELLKRLGERKRPLVLYIDDLQWGDVDSADLLVDLVRPPGSPRLLLLGSYRTEGIGQAPCLIELEEKYTRGDPAPARLNMEVGALNLNDSTELALKLLARDDPQAHDLASRIARESAGWPFFVWELTQVIQHGSDIAEETLDLDEVIWARACRLPDATRQLLELVAVVARPIPVAEAYRALDELERGQSLLSQLRTASFVRTTTDARHGTVVECYHDRIRESVASRLEQSTVQRHHLSIALTIEEASGITSADRDHWLKSTTPLTDEVVTLTSDQWNCVFDLARHYASGGQPQQALPYALIAAEQAKRQDALEVAEQQFRVAELAISEAERNVQFRIANGLGDVLMLRGKYEEAEHRFTSAHQFAEDDLVRIKTDRKLGELAFKRGRLQEAAEILETALRNMGCWIPRTITGYLAGVAWEGWVQLLHTLLPNLFVHRLNGIPTGSERVRISLMSRLSYLNWFARGAIPTFWSHLAEMNRAEKYLPSLELAQAWSEHGPAMTMIPLHKRGIHYARNSLKIRRAHGHRWGEAQSLNFLGMTLHTAGRLPEAVDALEQAAEIFDRTGDWWEENLVHYQLGLVHYQLGHLDRAAELSEHVHRSGIELGDEQASGISLHCWAMATMGRQPSDEIICTELNRERADAQCTVQVLLADAVKRYYSDDLLVASERLNEARLVIRRNTLRSVYVAPVYSWHATILRTRLQNGSTTGPAGRALLRQANAAVRTARFIAWTYPVERPHALREAGQIARLQGLRKKSERCFEASLDEAERLRMKHQAQLTNRLLQDPN